MSPVIPLANGHGGVLLVGVTPSGKPTGIADSADTRAVVHAAGLLAFPPLILPLPQTIEYEGKTVCLVEVPPGLPHVYSVDGRYLTRTGPQNRLLSAAELGALLLARGEAGFESRPALGAALDDLDSMQVRAYANLLGYPPTGFPDSPKDPAAANDLREGSDGYNALLSRGCLTQTAGSVATW